MTEFGVERLPVGEVSAQVFLRGPGITDPALDPEPALIAIINAAKHTFYGLVFSITLADVANAIIAAHQRGVEVHLVCDATEAQGKTSQVHNIAAAGVDIRLWGGNYREAHDKVAIIDGRACVTGSYNWSGLAEHSNIENMFVLSGTRVTKVVVPAFMTQWQNAYNTGVAAT